MEIYKSRKHVLAKSKNMHRFTNIQQRFKWHRSKNCSIQKDWGLYGKHTVQKIKCLQLLQLCVLLSVCSFNVDDSSYWDTELYTFVSFYSPVAISVSFLSHVLRHVQASIFVVQWIRRQHIQQIFVSRGGNVANKYHSKIITHHLVHNQAFEN